MKIRAYIVILLSIVATYIYIANAQSRSLKNIKEKKAQNEQVIRESNIKLSENELKLSKQLDELNSLNVQIKETNSQVEKEQATLDSINIVIRNVNDTIAIYQRQLDVMKKQYAEAARQMYIRRGDMNALAFIFSSDSFKQAYRRMRYMRRFSQWRDNKTKEISELQDILLKRKQRLSSLKTDKARAIANINSVLQGLNSDKKKTDELVAALNKEKKSLQSLIKKKEKESKQLDEDIERIIEEEQRRQEELRRQEEVRKQKEEAERRIREERRRQEIADSIRLVKEKERQEAEKRHKDSIEATNKKIAETVQPKKDVEKEVKKEPEKEKKVEKKVEEKVEKVSPKPVEKKVEVKNVVAKKASAEITAGFKSSKGKLPYPVKGKYRVVREFGQQKHPNLKYVTTDSKGIYIETPGSADVIAVYEGEVSRVLSHRTYNTIIIVRHGDYFAIYCNVANALVKEGEIINQGQKLGSVFVPAGEDTGILHFQVRCGRDELDPMKWLK